MSISIKLHFLGASGMVTGSKYQLQIPGKSILIDCGLFQGLKKLRELNWQQLPVSASDIDLVILTHGHLDHCGYLPRLVKNGYRGAIWGTQPTLDIAEIILRDSARIQTEDAERANKKGFTKHKPALPLYTTEDVDLTTPLFEAKKSGEWIRIDGNIKVRFRNSGHIPGATFLEFEISGKKVVFSGDIGRETDPLMYTPEKPDIADVLIMESTYGDRIHPKEDLEEKLLNVINHTLKKNGSLFIPGFAVERAQMLMYLIWQLHIQNKLPGNIPVYLDTPMGAGVLDLFRKHPQWHKLSNEEFTHMCNRVKVVQSYAETIDIINNKKSKIVIAGSGMITGGRILSYLDKYISKEETTILLTGYMAEGTRGRSLKDGAVEIKFFGKLYPVKATIESLENLSAHADQAELLNWISELKTPPKQIFLVHGELQASTALKAKIKEQYGWDAVIPELYQIHEIDDYLLN
jgi:metallo-beta-lactamase family protein